MTTLLADTVTAYRVLVNEVVLDGFGHISVRAPDNPDRFWMPRAMPPSLVQVEDFLELDVATSQPVDARGRRVNGERYLHWRGRAPSASASAGRSPGCRSTTGGAA